MDLKLRQYIKMAAQNIYLPAVYLLYRHRKTRPDLILFADAHHSQRPDNFSLLIRELKNRGADIEEMYLDYQHTSYKNVLIHMTGFMKAYARAGTVVICDNFLPAASCRKKRETRLVQLWHACGALKKFGYDTAEDIPANYKGHVFRGTDLVTVSSEICRSPFAGAMKLPVENVQALGVSRTDRYFDPEWIAKSREKFYQCYPQAQGRRVVLWAPTFRGNPGEPQSIDLNMEELQRLLGPEYFLLSSLHPHMQKEKAAAMTTEEMLPAVDLLIADYSSLIFEYCLLGKPLVLYTPDFETYTQKRGFYMPYKDIPGQQIFQEEELENAIKEGLRNGMEEEQKNRFLSVYMAQCDGHATKRIADAIYAKEQRKPI